MNYTHLTIEERCCLREYYKKGYSYRKIAELMGRNVSTVSRELNRNFTHMYDIPTYYPHTAHNTNSDVRFVGVGCFRIRRSWSTLKKNCCSRGHWSKSSTRLASWRCLLFAQYTDGLMTSISTWIWKCCAAKEKATAKKETRGKFNLGKSIRKRDRSVWSKIPCIAGNLVMFFEQGKLTVFTKVPKFLPNLCTILQLFF